MTICRREPHRQRVVVARRVVVVAQARVVDPPVADMQHVFRRKSPFLSRQYPVAAAPDKHRKQ